MSRFRTLEVSDPSLESENLRHLTIQSPALKGRGDVTLFVPPGKNLKDLPLVLLLHGVFGSHWAWTRLGGAHRTALGLIEAGRMRPMVLAMPSDGLWGDGSGYLAHDGVDFEKWILEDVVDAAREVVPQTGTSSPLYISGLSMGGYGALRLGAKHPKRFKAFSAHSSITDKRSMDEFAEPKFEIASPEEGSVLSWMLKNKVTLPPFRFDCGKDDGLVDVNRELDRKLTEAGIKHTYEEFDGEHSWAYWREHLKESLLFFEKNQ